MEQIRINNDGYNIKLYTYPEPNSDPTVVMTQPHIDKLCSYQWLYDEEIH